MNKLLAASLLTPVVIAGFAASAASPQDRTAEVRQSVKSGRARQVILFLGDGMGDSEITLARNYHLGAAGRLAMDSLPMTGAYTTYSLHEEDPTHPDYVTDSAASATGWATGRKTSNGRISTQVASTTVSPLQTLLEKAQAAGFKTGDVSTAELTDATPAALAAHVNDRACEGPSDMESCKIYRKSSGGPGSIAEQMIDHHVDVLLGGGRARFDQPIDAGPYVGKTVAESAVAQGYRFVSDATSLSNFVADQPLLGLFAPGNMTLEWSGESAKPFPGSGPQTCKENQRPPNEPSLADMTRKALELLSAHAAKSKGFFLQVEGASIDKQDHAANPCGQIGETIAFDAAIAVGLDFAAKHPDTLLVVTADHAHASQIIDQVPAQESNHPGSYSMLNTADGAIMTVNYANAPAGKSQRHTGTEVRIAAQGPQAANVTGVIDQTDLHHIMARAMGLE